MNEHVAYGQSTLPAGIRSRFIENVNDLTMHVLEAGHESGDRPLLILLHGFPELAYSWRKVMVPLADAGYHVVAPDQRIVLGDSAVVVEPDGGSVVVRQVLGRMSPGPAWIAICRDHVQQNKGCHGDKGQNILPFPKGFGKGHGTEFWSL